MFRERARGFADNLWRNTSSLLDGLSKDMKIYMVCISNNLIYNYLYIYNYIYIIIYIYNYFFSLHSARDLSKSPACTHRQQKLL